MFFICSNRNQIQHYIPPKYDWYIHDMSNINALYIQIVHTDLIFYFI